MTDPPAPRGWERRIGARIDLPCIGTGREYRRWLQRRYPPTDDESSEEDDEDTVITVERH